jgi:hypothetical protein
MLAKQVLIKPLYSKRLVNLYVKQHEVKTDYSQGILENLANTFKQITGIKKFIKDIASEFEVPP